VPLVVRTVHSSSTSSTSTRADFVRTSTLPARSIDTLPDRVLTLRSPSRPRHSIRPEVVPIAMSAVSSQRTSIALLEESMR
jgi:hypothetical protein